MQSRQGVHAYRQTDLSTMSKEKLIVMLYQKLLEHLSVASERADGDRAEMARRLGLAQRIVSELRSALDHAVGGEVADNLAALYGYVFKEILAMQVDRDVQHAANCRQVLTPLLEAWRQIPPGTAERARRNDQCSGTETAMGNPGQRAAPDGQATPGNERLVSTSA